MGNGIKDTSVDPVDSKNNENNNKDKEIVSVIVG